MHGRALARIDSISQRRQFFVHDDESAVEVIEPGNRTFAREMLLGGLLDEHGILGARKLEKLINELPPKCRTAFLLYKIQGLDFAAVAAQMGLSERMVRDYVVRAVLYCRVGLDAALANEGPSHG